MSFSEKISPLLGRLALAWFFLGAAMDAINHWHSTIGYLSDHNIPAAPLMLVFALICIFLGSFSLILGFHTRHGAVLLFGFTLVVSVAMHAFWRIDDPAARAAEFEIFARNIAIAGGLLLMVGMGPGPFAIDNPGKGKR
ncbi:MAG TPA: DoxX family protein [Rhizomicrobium sp.]